MKKAVVISMINYKGGVAKTTSVFNIAAGLRFLASKCVLMIDLDPQCSLTHLCLKALSRTTHKKYGIEDLEEKQTINYVFRQYLEQTKLSLPPQIDLNDIILKDFYSGHKIIKCKELDVIPTTMFDSNKNINGGLDDLEIDIAMQHFGKSTMVSHTTMLSKFFHDTDIDNKYDFIIFDCPPSNTLITQNALVVSDYYLIPTIMDDMSSYGIPHLDSLIQNTIFRQIGALCDGIDDRHKKDTYLRYIEKGAPALLGVFETLLKTNVDSSQFRISIGKRFHLFKSIIYNHIGTARKSGLGYACFSVNIARNNYSPHISYGNLIAEILNATNTPYDTITLDKRITQWF